jgi:hypothetical protein
MSNNSSLSFTITTSNGTFQTLKDKTFQIMPTRTRIVNYKKFKPINEPTNILLHTGYDVRPWSQEIFNPSSYQLSLIDSYITTSKILNVKEILIHGPDTPERIEYLISGLKLLKSLNTKIPFVIEMPAFCQSMFNDQYMNNKYEFIKSYFNTCVTEGFNIVPDTAHLYANGLTTKEIIEILNIFKDDYTFIHLNGNSKPQYKHDKHTTLTPLTGYETNKIESSEELLSHVAKLNKICISEQKCNNLKYFTELANKYGFKLIDIPETLII